MGTEEQWAQRNSGYRERVSIEEQWERWNSGHRGHDPLEEKGLVLSITFPLFKNPGIERKKIGFLPFHNIKI